MMVRFVIELMRILESNVTLGALQLDRLERIIVDASHIDQKKRGILEMKETQVPLTLWLGQASIRERYTATSGSIELMFY